jgi:hypothetical protein
MRVLSSLLLVLLVVGLAAGTASAQDEKFINLALFNPVQIYNETTDVKGIRLTAFWSKNANVTGFDWGWIALGQVTGDFKGVQWNPINMVGGHSTGWQAGLVNYTQGGYLGLQTAAVNYDMGAGEGVQFGFVNIGKETSGLQLGFFNMTETMTSGIQIGIINVIKSKEKLPILPLVNWSF